MQLCVLVKHSGASSFCLREARQCGSNFSSPIEGEEKGEGEILRLRLRMTKKLAMTWQVITQRYKHIKCHPTI